MATCTAPKKAPASSMTRSAFLPRRWPGLVIGLSALALHALCLGEQRRVNQAWLDEQPAKLVPGGGVRLA
jgi:hypothetical protein